MADTIKIFTRNILETGTVTVTGTPDTGFPEARLYDRGISLYWKDTVTEAKTFHVDQGASNIYDVDFLAVFRHNFAARAMTWEHSGDDVSFTAAVTGWNQSGSDAIIKTLGAALTKRYWRVTVESMANPKCGEVFMSEGLELDILARPGTKARKDSNVRWNRTVGRVERSTQFGERRRVRSYPLFPDTTDLDSLRAALDDIGSMFKPFWIKDHEGDYWLCRLTNDPLENWDHLTNKHIVLNVIEVL